MTYDAVADSKGLPDEDVDPADEARDRSLKRESENERREPERSRGGVPVDEDRRDQDEHDRQCDEQVEDPPQVVARDRVVESRYENTFRGSFGEQDEKDEDGTQ
jgi:hypothetical protein